MPATVTLSTLTLASNVRMGDNRIKVSSTTGLVPGVRLFEGGELMEVVGLLPDPWVSVRRGVDGTATVPHNSSATVYIGAANQFYSTDPIGRPNAAVLVSPWINARTNRIWFAQGDSLPTETGNRWWQEAVNTYAPGSLGVQTVTTSPTSST